MLRIRFDARNGQPVQFEDSAPVELEQRDLRDDPAQAAGLVRALGLEPFDLTRGPLFRVLLLRLGDASYQIAVVFHHIIFDGWSQAIFFRELAELYQSAASGRPASLPALPIQYIDFVFWQRQFLTGAVLKRHLDHWRRALSGFPLLPLLPTDRPRPAMQDPRGAGRSFWISPATVQALEELSAEEGATPFIVLLSAFSVLIHTRTQQEQFVIGSPIANRTRPEVEGLIGFFVNTLVLPVDVSGDPSFRALIQRVRELALGAYAHQDLPFEKLVEELQPTRSLSHHPLFQIMFVLQNTPSTFEGSLQGTESQVGALQEGLLSKFDLSVSLTPCGDGLMGMAEYSTALFDHDTIARMIEAFCVLLDGAARSPGAKISALPYLPDAERALIARWRTPPTPPPVPGGTVLDLITGHMTALPEAVALRSSSMVLTYAQLGALVDQIVQRLREAGVQHGEFVGVFLPRSPVAVAAVLAIWKLGAVYVALDPDHPPERLAFVMTDAGLSVLVTTRRLLRKVPEHSAEMVLLDLRSQPEPGATLPSSARADDVAYLLYTSGSTGKPKGALIAHRGLRNLAAVQQRLFQLGQGDRILQFASAGFDMAIWDIVLALGAGASLYLGRPAELLPGRALSATLHDQKITTATLPPSVLAMLSPVGLEGLTTLIVAGELCSAALMRRWHRGRRFYNAYGPTEATICASVELCEDTHAPPGIGRPLDNVSIEVLDARGEPVPIGAEGELWIGGVGVSPGYHSRPTLNATRFVDDPNTPGSRRYRTGDRVRYRSDGVLEFLGRQDTQVKIRGCRIELREIEAALLEQEPIQDTVVVVNQGETGEPFLEAHIVLSEGATMSPGRLRASLRRWLPDYMIPSGLVEHAAFPRGPTGKVDRGALSGQGLENTFPDVPFTSPQTRTERQLVEMWSEVLGVERISTNDNFFELGGHSLMAAQIAGRVQEVFHIELPLQVVFEHTTITELAARIDTSTQAGMHSAGRSTSGPVAAPPRARLRQEPVSYAQERLWFIEQLAPGNAAYNIPGGFRWSAPIAVDVLRNALTLLVRRHEALRTVFSVEGGEPVQVISPSVQVELPLEDLTHLPASEREVEASRRARAEGQRPFDLSRGPLMRVRLYRLAPADHVLSVTFHHIVSDGWSMGVFFRELRTLYADSLAGRPPSLLPLPIQYADHARWQREHLSGDILASRLAFWRTTLAGAPETHSLPLDRPRPPVQRSVGSAQQFGWDVQQRRTLEALAVEERATLFMVLLSTFSVVMSLTSGQPTVVIGSPIANRTRPEVEGLIGFFVNTLVLPVDVSGDPSFRTLIQRVRELALGAYAHQDLPFEKLVEELQPARSLSHHPLFQIMFILQNAPDAPGGAEAPLPTRPPEETVHESGSVKFDMTVTLAESKAGISGYLEYDTAIFSDATVSRFIHHFDRVLRHLSQAPDAPLSTLPLLTEPEHARLQQLQGQVDGGIPLWKSLAAVVSSSPDAIAVESGRASLTFATLDQQARALAGRLQTLQLSGPVLLVIHPSPAWLVGWLGVLLAGLDCVMAAPDTPPARLEAAVSEAGCVLTSRRTRLPRRATLPEPLVLEALLDDPGTAVPRPMGSVILLTPGTDGRPDALRMDASALGGLAAALGGIEAGSRVLSAAALDDPLALWEALLALTAGATLCIPPPRERVCGAPLGAFLAEKAIDTALLSNDHLQTLSPDALPSLTSLVLYGPLPSRSRLRRWEQGRRVWRLYDHPAGPIGALLAEPPLEPHHLGRPLSHARAILLDDRGQPTLPGAVGWLHLQGHGEPVRSGDRARWLDSGVLALTQPNEALLVHHGQRLDLRVIEAALCALEGVEDAAIIRRVVPGEGPILEALLVLKEGENLSRGQLRSRLRRWLPDVAIPRLSRPVPRLARRPGGALDRLALGHTSAAVVSGTTGVLPESQELIEQIGAIWAEELAVEQVGIDDNFFQLGGHSLLAIRVVAQIQDRFQIEVPVREIFEAATLGAFCVVVERRLESAPGVDAIQRTHAHTCVPSFAQERMWFLDRLNPGSPFYNVCGAFNWAAPMDEALLHRVLVEIIVRHEILRTTFEVRGGRLLQIIAEEPTVSLELIDLSARSNRDEEAARLSSEEARRAFDLAQGPLLRVKLLRLADEQHVLIVCQHHIIADAWSQGIFFRELRVLYSAFAEQRPSPLRGLPIQYADFAQWQRAQLQGERLSQQIAFWRDALAGAPPVLSMPTDHPRPAIQSFLGANQTFLIPPAQRSALEAIAREEQASLFMAAFSVFFALLHIYTGSDDLIVGTPTANRQRADLQDLIGLFVNSIAIRVDLSEDPSFREVVRRLRQVVLDAFANGELPFERLVEELQPTRSLAHNPIFQVMFVLQPAGDTLDGLLAEERYTDGQLIQGTVAKFDLSMFLVDTGEQLRGLLEYSTDLYTHATMARFRGHFQHLVRAVCAAPDQPLSTLSVLSGPELHQLERWNDTTRFVRDETVLDLVARNFWMQPWAPAVRHGEDVLRYGQLQKQSAQLAQHLQKQGTVAGEPVGLFLERSLDMIVGVLGILRAGAAIVSLDPTYPESRLQQIVQDAGCRCIVTSSALLDRVPPSPITINTDTLPTPGHHTALVNAVHPTQPIYILYTSGSTGRPKGVRMSHRAVYNLVRWQIRGAGVGDRVLQFASLNFDVSFQEIFSCLGSGGTLSLIDEDTRRDPAAVWNLIEQQQLETVFMPPTALQQLAIAAEERLELPDSLGLLITAGEALRITPAIRRMFARLSDCALRNQYGPSETHVATEHRLPGEPESWPELPSIGRPIDNVAVHLLDGHARPVPIGVTGELHVSGAGLAEGYLHRPEATAARFVDRSGRRMYCTGDLARWSLNGTLEFLGRTDDQVKIRGYRVELGEVESCLNQHPDVAAAATRLWSPRVDAEQRLIAFVVFRDPDKASVTGLRSFLAERLPRFMVPSIISPIDALPLTPSGKVARSALPAPVGQRVEYVQYEAAGNSLEESIMRQWSELLCIERVGVQDDFFESGGHSLLATQLLGRLRNIFQVDVPVRCFYETPTIRGLGLSVCVELANQMRPGQAELILSDLEEETVREEQATTSAEAPS